MTARKSLLIAAIIPVVGALLALSRWLIQGSGNLYTDLGRRLYVPDPVLGWRIADAEPVWLGLDTIGALAAAAAFAVVVAVMISRREKRIDHSVAWVRGGLTAIGAACMVMPVWAFASGFAPSGARDALPDRAVMPPATGIAGNIEGAAPGRYAIADGAGSLVIAHLSAGGEAFEASFSDVHGHLRGDPGDLRQPLTATFDIAASSVDTGIDMRSKHARGYLKADEFPRIGLSLTELSGTRQTTPTEIEFSARGDVSLMGGVHPVTITGTMASVSPAARDRLGLGDAPALVIKARFSIDILKTALAPDAGDFDDPKIPISVTLVLTHQPQGTK